MKYSLKLQLVQRLTGRTQEQLAGELGVSFATLNSWKNGKSEPRKLKGKLIDELYMKVTGEKKIPSTVLSAKKRIIQEKANKKRNLIKYIQDHPDIYDELTLQLTYNTNRIEGSSLTVRETAAVIFDNVSLPDKDLIEHLEAKNHQTAFDFMMANVSKDFVVKEAFVWQLHRILMNGIRRDAGYYRSHGVRIVGSSVPTANYLKVPELIEKLVKDMNRDRKDIVKHVTEIHSRFEQIHPFSDGNGRIGRLLMSVMLLRNNIAPALIKQEEKQLYYTYLEKSQRTEDNSLLQDFLCDAVIDGFSLIDIAKTSE